MKKLILLPFLIVTIALISSCKKDQETPNTPFLSARLGNASWKGNVETMFHNDTLFIWGHKGEEHLLFKIKLNGVGNYPLNKHQSRYYVTVGQDALIADYIPTDEATNQLRVTAIDSTKKTITGTFNISCNKLARPEAPNSSDKIQFTEGKFKAQLP